MPQTGRRPLALPLDNATITMNLQLELNVQNNCIKAAILEFPSDGFTREQRKSGWVILHVVIACYCFWLLAIVCDDYFVDAVKAMCSSKYLL